VVALYYSAIARAMLAVRSRRKLAPVNKNIQRRSPTRRAIGAAVRNILIRRNGRVWVKVQTGLAKGLWLRLKLQSEQKYWLGYHETEVQEALRTLLVPGTVAFDIGAHLGFFSMAMAKLLGSRGKIFAFEPDPESAERIQEHALRNNLTPRITLQREAVWAYSCPTGIPFKRGSIKRDHGGVCADGNMPPLGDGECISVTSVTLDGLVQKGYPAPDVIKVDVEGGECEVLKGGRELLSTAKITLICEIHSNEAVSWIIGWLRERGYALQWLTPNGILPSLVVARRA
jgi:FkbM family methyltransferase